MPDTDIAIIGAGRTGRQVAALSATLGLRVVLFEREAVVPLPRVATQAVLDASRRAASWGDVRAAVRAALADAAPEVSAARFEGMGVEVVHAPARFAAPDRVAAGGREWRFRRCLVDAGSAPVVPDVPGLEGVPWVTPAAFPMLDELPGHLIVLGGEAAGLELGQAAARLGARVTVVAPIRIAPAEDFEFADGLARVLAREGVTILSGHGAARVDAVQVDGRGGAVTVTLSDGAVVEGTHLLLAMEEAPRVAGLDLTAGNVAGGPGGIAVTESLRSTTNRRVWAAGRVAAVRGWAWAGGSVESHVGVVARNMVFRLPAKVPEGPAPRLIRTDPALVQVGPTAFGAEEDGHEVRALRWPVAHTERSAASGRAEGLVKLVADAKGRLLGAGVLAPGAEEMAAVLGLAVSRRMSLSALAGLDLPGPAYSEAIRQAAASFYGPRITGETARRLVRVAKLIP